MQLGTYLLVCRGQRADRTAQPSRRRRHVSVGGHDDARRRVACRDGRLLEARN